MTPRRVEPAENEADGAPEAVLVSTVTPVYSGEAYLRALMDGLAAVGARWDREGAPVRLVECIFVDDGSVDGSARVLEEIAAEHPHVTIVSLSRNFGQHPATVAGVLHSCGDWVFTLDEDLQHDPSRIPTLLEAAVRGGHDVVYAHPTEAIHQSKLRDWGSQGFKAAVGFLTGNPFVKDFNSFRALRGSIARAAASVSSHATYFDAALSWFSQRVGVVNLPMKDVRYIRTGDSGYDLRKLLSHARRLVITLQTNWLRLGALIGVSALALSVALGAWLLIQVLVAPESIVVRGWLSLFLAVLFFGGLTTSLVGVLLEYMSTVVHFSQGKPVFFVVDRSKDGVLLEYFSTGPASAAADGSS